jgi:DNA polymerase I-like protein with 3'-5' exonuclease and polymerase domains
VRSDAIGLFWQDIPRTKGGGVQRAMPPIPETGWTPPTYFPDLSYAKALSIDVETKDLDLEDKGPGWARHAGHIVGIAVGTDDGHRWYFPMRHEVQKELNLDPDHVTAWARDQFKNPRQPKIGANITYDVGWCREEGITVAGPLYDCLFAEALLEERRKINLDDLGERYEGKGKTGDILYQWCADFYGGKVDHKQRKNIYRAPPCLVGPYAEGDVDLPFSVLEKQWKRLSNEGLLHIFDMECRLIPLMIEMRFAGVRIDLAHAERMLAYLTEEIDEIDAQIKHIVGFEVNTEASSSLAAAFDVAGLSYGYTNAKEPKPSFTATFLQSVDHPLAELVLKKKTRKKLRGTFVEGYILDSHVNGRLYGSFHQLRGDDGGTRSGRLSSSNPNLQNIPIRSKTGKVIRQAFIPDEGHLRWRKYDYSQIEYRGLAHYAVGPGSEGVRARYNSDPNTDFHVMVQSIIREVVGLELDRSSVKTTNFGTVYGMGERKLQRSLNLSKQESKELMAAIHNGAPFMRSTMDACMEEAGKLGYITTILGRRSRFDLWVPEKYSEDAIPLPWERAILSYRSPVRAYLHKALNRRLQGSAADLIKKAMLMCWEGGVFAETGVPRLTVHDELDFSDPGGKDEAFREMVHIMETAIPFNVPIKVGCDVGPSWGEVTELT